ITTTPSIIAASIPSPSIKKMLLEKKKRYAKYRSNKVMKDNYIFDNMNHMDGKLKERITTLFNMKDIADNYAKALSYFSVKVLCNETVIKALDDSANMIYSVACSNISTNSDGSDIMLHESSIGYETEREKSSRRLRNRRRIDKYKLEYNKSATKVIELYIELVDKDIAKLEECNNSLGISAAEFNNDDACDDQTIYPQFV
ncbi:MAG: hypothetical protein QS748_14620, partial [Candidatus Endonucleobacter bathymodioli]|nr:hypothetical protein [Candidatus Endonucleobacter bathymodioli]